jgi:peptide/nickel transport system permease protein
MSTISIAMAPSRGSLRIIRHRARQLGGFVWRLLAAFIPVFLLGSFFTFALGAISGLNPAPLQLGDGASLSAVHALERKWGLTRPFFDQYFTWLGHILSGNLGKSWANNNPVSTLLEGRAIITLSAAGVALLIGVLFGFALGSLAARYQDTWIDRTVTIVSATISTLPPFIAGVVLIDLFATTFHLLPSGGYDSMSQGFWAWFSHIILPAIALSFDTVADVARQLRIGLVSAKRQHYVTGAVVRGLSARRVFWVHTLRNALGPSIAVLGLKFPALLGGAVVTESIFQLSGYGVFATQSAVQGDVPSVQAVLVVAVILVVIFNMFVNIILNALIPSASRGT